MKEITKGVCAGRENIRSKDWVLVPAVLGGIYRGDRRNDGGGEGKPRDVYLCIYY